MHITVLGAGAWGTALAARAALVHPTVLWGRDAAQVATLVETGRNARYLPDLQLPAALRCTADWSQALAHLQDAKQERPPVKCHGNPTGGGNLVIVASPMAALRELLARIPTGLPTLWLSKGFEAGSGLLGHELAREVAPQLRCGVLSGPSFAAEVAQGQPTALVAASLDADLRAAAVQALHGGSLRIYASDDPVGVEVGGAVKNVLAIATGIADGMALGLNARAALITRGLAEMTRLGLALGARAETFMGLSGLGDLVLTATGDLSRNRRVGLRLAEGQSLPQILQALGHVSEGVYSARTVLDRATRLGVEMPITAAVVAVLQGELAPRAAVAALMQREARAES
ncbi:MAG: NAD(P)H-dependent glycerol-3-phosphate dehydrogenase [Leptothrix sp. (in: b-proteobacteria)]